VSLVRRCILAAAVVFGTAAWLPWAFVDNAWHIAARRLISVDRLPAPRSPVASLGIVILVIGLAGSAGAAARHRAVCAAVAFLALAVTVLWAVMMSVYRAPRDFTATDIDLGAWMASGASLLLMATAMWRRRAEVDQASR
jgi:hypothetical protein